ncbi:MAG: TonB family protein [Nitrospira sp.]|nr:MAG: TonB family protein [Nitrospira sp.]
MATLLFAAYIVMSPQQTLAENGESFGSSSVDYSKPCNKLLSAAPRLPSKRESLADEISSDLNRELQDLKNLQTSPPVKYSEPTREIKPMFREAQPVASAPPLTSSVPRSTPESRLRVEGMPGANPYLARVHARIRGFWTAPPVDISGKALTTIVKFNLERDGRVGSVIIEKSSGNDYYDMAAQRAVQAAIPLPPFPPDLTDSYFDAYFTFAVGEAATYLETPSSNKPAEEQATMFSEQELRDCESQLSLMFNAIHQVPESEDGLKTLQRITRDLPRLGRVERYSREYSNLVDTVENLHDDIRTKAEGISKKIAFENKFRQFDKLCEGKIAKGGMPPRFRNEPVYSGLSGRPETMTLGRTFCTAINGGGKAEFQVLDEKTPTISISVTTKKRRFTVIFQKKMQADLSEAWRAVEIRTPSDRRPAYEFLGQTFTDRFPELVQDE